METRRTGSASLAIPVLFLVSPDKLISKDANTISFIFQLAESKKEASRAQEASRAVLLTNAPSLVVERFLNGDQQKSTSYKAGTVLACSFVNLNQFVELFSADDVSTTMDELVTGIDQIVFSSNVNRLSMNGEHLLFASEPKTRSAAQVQTISNFAIMLMNFLERLSHKTPARYTLQMKIGIGTGFVFEGVLGKTIPKYTIVGEAVTIAFKMLASARPRTIRLSRSTHDMLKQHGAMFETTILKSCQTVCKVHIQSTLVISTSVISNNRLSRRKNLVLVKTQKSKIRLENIVEKRRNCSWGAISPLLHNIFNIYF